MKHPNDQIWTDYVRGTADPSMVEALDEHLGTGCSNCAQRVSTLENVVRVSRVDRNLEVPAAAFRAVRNLFRIQQLLEKQEAPRRCLRLSFDSLLAPAPAGTRNADSQRRHLVYESDEMTVDLQIEPEDGPHDLRVRGHVLDSGSSPIAEVPAFMHHGGRVFSQDFSSGMGEFSLRGAAADSTHVCLLVADDQLVDLELPSFANRPSAPSLGMTE